MAQAAHQLNQVQLSTEKDPKEARGQVKEVLKRYKKLNAMIEQAEAVAAGEGLAHDFRLQVSESEIEQLASVGRTYTTDHKELIHQTRAETLFANTQGDDTEDQAALDRITEIMTGTAAWGDDGVVWHNRVMTRQSARELAARDAAEYRQEQAFVNRALFQLASFSPHYEKLIRMRYIDGKTTTATAAALNVSARQQDNWHNNALDELAVLLRISRGY